MQSHHGVELRGCRFELILHVLADMVRTHLGVQERWPPYRGEALTLALMENGVQAVGYETVQLDNGVLPLLTPMSEVAGRMSVQVGAYFLEKAHGGRGTLLGGVPGVPGAEVAIIGGGVVGYVLTGTGNFKYDEKTKRFWYDD